MKLAPFDVRGEEVVDEATETVLRPGEPRRALLRYRPDGSERFIHVRLNVALIATGIDLPWVRVKPESRPDERMPDGLLVGEGSRRNYEFLERLCDDVVRAGAAARYVAEEHGEGRRDFYFVVEDCDAFESLARGAAAASDFPVGFERLRIAELATVLFPTELIGDLALPIPPGQEKRRTRFEFWGVEPRLSQLRDALVLRGYTYRSLEPALGLLHVEKVVPVDGPGFLTVLREVAPLAHDLRCVYRGTETVGGFDQFRITQPLPKKYAESAWRRLLRRLGG